MEGYKEFRDMWRNRGRAKLNEIIIVEDNDYLCAKVIFIDNVCFVLRVGVASYFIEVIILVTGISN